MNTGAMGRRRNRITTSALQGRAWVDAQYALERKRVLEVRKLPSAVTRQMSELPPEWRRSGGLTHPRIRKGPNRSRRVVVGVRNSTAKDSRRVQQSQRQARLSNDPPRRTKDRQIAQPGMVLYSETDSGRRRRLSYVLPVTGKPFGSAQTKVRKITGKKKDVLTLGRLRELRRMAKRQKPPAFIFHEEIVAPNGLAQPSPVRWATQRRKVSGGLPSLGKRR